MVEGRGGDDDDEVVIKRDGNGEEEELLTWGGGVDGEGLIYWRAGVVARHCSLEV